MVRTKKGFTLVELMVVIVIIGILAALAIPKFTEASVKAKVAEAPTVLSTFDNALLAYLAETSDIPSAMSDLVIDDPSTADFSNWFNYGPTLAAASGALAATPIKKMGLAATTDNVTTSVSDEGVVTHTNTAGFNRYLPNWAN